MRLRFAAHSETGLVRKNNQDSGYASPNLLVVADGMGGAAAGDLASAVAIDTLRKVDEPTAGEQMLEVLAGAMHRANDRIADLVEEDYALEGMGTTVTGALFDGTQFGLAHIGDSRAYLMHDSRLERLTHDHSWVQSLVDTGKISEDEAGVHPHRSLLLKVLNGQPANEPDLTMVRVEVGDRIMLCSDGLCGLVDDPVIEAAMRTPDLVAALDRLVAQARAEGGIDNITVILAEVVASGAADQPVVLGAAAELAIPSPETRLRPGADTAAATGASGAAGSTRASGAADPTEAAAPPGRPGGEPETHGDDEARYSPQPPHARPVRRRLAVAVLATLVVVAALGSAYAWTRTQFYVGVSGERVAIFQGLDQRLPGVSLSRLYEVQPLAVSALPPYYQERVRASIDVADLAGARRTVTELADAARRCAATAPSVPARPTPRASTPAASAITSTPARPVPAKSSPARTTTQQATSPSPGPLRTATPPPASPRSTPATPNPLPEC